MTTAIWIVFFVVLFFLHVAAESKREERQEQEQREEAAKETQHDLIRHAAPDILAYDVPDSQKAPPDPNELPPEPGPDDELIDLEKGKWSLVNAGRLLAGLMLTPGSVNVGYQPVGAITLEVKKGSWEKPVGFSDHPEPFTLKDFRVTRPGPETAVLSYAAESGYQKLNATTLWTKRAGRWVTSSYQIVKG